MSIFYALVLLVFVYRLGRGVNIIVVVGTRWVFDSVGIDWF